MSESNNIVDTPAPSSRLLRISMIGAGNVATHMAQALDRVAHVVQVCSRHPESAAALASKLRAAQPIASLDELSHDSDFYIIAASDDSVAAIASATPDHPGIWAHTSGSVDMDVFRGLKSRFGVFYPLQTFSKDVEVDFQSVPMFVEGCCADVATRLLSLARSVSSNVEVADSQQRRRLHLAAVFANNFTNHLWAKADELLRTDGYDITKLLPLLQVTLQKLLSVSPRDAQTGPARRGDAATIARHLDMLPDHLRPLYRMFSESIMQEYSPNKQILRNEQD